MNHPDDLEWQAAVGKAIIRFGDIELVSIRSYDFIKHDKSITQLLEIPFAKRTKTLLVGLRRESNHDTFWSSLIRGLERAIELAHTRNLIAHNPVMLDIYQSVDGARLQMEHTVRSTRNPMKVLNLDGLKEFADEVESLSSEIWMSFLNLSRTSEALWRDIHP